MLIIGCDYHPGFHGDFDVGLHCGVRWLHRHAQQSQRKHQIHHS